MLTLSIMQATSPVERVKLISVVIVASHFGSKKSPAIGPKSLVMANSGSPSVSILSAQAAKRLAFSSP